MIWKRFTSTKRFGLILKILGSTPLTEKCKLGFRVICCELNIFICSQHQELWIKIPLSNRKLNIGSQKWVTRHKILLLLQQPSKSPDVILLKNRRSELKKKKIIILPWFLHIFIRGKKKSRVMGPHVVPDLETFAAHLPHSLSLPISCPLAVNKGHLFQFYFFFNCEVLF